MNTKYLFPTLNEADKDFPLYVVTIGAEPFHAETCRPYGIQHHQLHFTLSGTAVISLNNKQINVQKNDIIYLRPGTPQHYWPTCAKWNTMWITYYQHNAYDILSLDNGVYHLPSIEPFTNILTLMLKKTNSVHFSKNASVLLYDLLLELRSHFKVANYLKKHSKLHYALNHIEKNYFTQIDISHLADISNMSEAYFCRLFKSQYNISPLQYVKKLRLQDAKNKLIQTPHMSITDIAHSVGYESPSYFIKLFKEQEGLTPTDFRNSLF